MSTDHSASGDGMLANRHRPQSPRDLFISFTLIALQGFGGVLAIIQREIVDKRQWMTRDEFIEDWAVAQIMPGPNVVNLSLIIGDRYFGLRGAAAALTGMLAAPLALIMLLVLCYAQVSTHPGVSGALRGMGAVAIGLIAGTGFKLAGALKANPLGALLCAVLAAACFALVALLRWPLVWVLLGLGLIACAIAYAKLKR